jgi:hypothetical protein
MKSRSKELLEQSISAMVSAIEIYNKPDFKYREETFAILAINAWELLVKSKWLHDNNNKISSIYVYEYKQTKKGKPSKKATIKLTRSGNSFTHNLEYLIKKLIEKSEFPNTAWKNIKALIEIRDSAIHFLNKSGLFAVRLQEIGTATLKNYVQIIKDWFDKDLMEYNFYLMPLSFMKTPDQIEAIALNKEEENYIHFINRLENDKKEKDDYDVTINIDVKFIRSKAKDALNIQLTNNPNAPEVRMTEENIKEKYPWDYKDLLEKLNKRYSNFKQNKNFHAIKKPLIEDKKYVHIRLLDPTNPKSMKKKFYNPNILKEFDKHYIKKTK